ncbi:hypothetical protein Lal_00018718 [Lupinus albus]|uniref:CASP-like protein n=1 Tax=Lupinus albus TaxID=3870 RepID=A0A6A4PNF9_LUPAL|nr:hypothetical protein Lalb_Chr12g0207431 [Lupinus albus]KAF1868199.1 hypothetical protein Lal_00018718 [Lupinus albus]
MCFIALLHLYISYICLHYTFLLFFIKSHPYRKSNIEKRIIINMSASKESDTKLDVQSQPETSAPPPGTGGSAAGIFRRLKREDLMKRGSLGLRGIALVFSLISFILVASNKHGDWKEFDKYEEYRYLLAVTILSSLYTGGQVYRQVQELSTGKNLLQPRTAAIIDFFGDQIVAYMLISSSSSAIPITNKMREGADNIFTDTSSAAISLSIFAFLCIAISALISGYKLSTHAYI